MALPIERWWWRRLDEEWWRSPRAFCADASGRVCHVQGGPAPVPEHGRCPPPAKCVD